MKDRLALFLAAEQLTSRKFAELIDVQPSSISHLLSGRNKPGFDFLTKMFQCFPNLDPDWLILGKGAMYRTPNGVSPSENSEFGETPGVEARTEPKLPEMQTTPPQVSSDLFVAAPEETPVNSVAPENESIKSTEQPLQPSQYIPSIGIDDGVSKPSQIVVLFEDRTFTIYNAND